MKMPGCIPAESPGRTLLPDFSSRGGRRFLWHRRTTETANRIQTQSEWWCTNRLSIFVL